MKWIRRGLYLFCFLTGFLVAAHWDEGRDWVQQQSPAYQSKMMKLGDKVKQQVQIKLKKLH